MQKIRILPSTEYLRECFHYEPDTGKLFWKHRPKEHFKSLRAYFMFNGKFAGKEATSIDGEGYFQVGIDSKHYLQHRVIWKWMTDEEPPPSIDHKDLDPLNNRWINLRPATKNEQNWNSGVRKDNTSGYKGVSQSGGRWRAYIGINTGIKYIGSFSTAEEASAAYEAEARKLHGEFWRTK